MCITYAIIPPINIAKSMTMPMVLAAGNGEGVWVISPETGAKPGDKVS